MHSSMLVIARSLSPLSHIMLNPWAALNHGNPAAPLPLDPAHLCSIATVTLLSSSFWRHGVAGETRSWQKPCCNPLPPLRPVRASSPAVWGPRAKIRRYIRPDWMLNGRGWEQISSRTPAFADVVSK
jgi:hypothetical protein